MVLFEFFATTVLFLNAYAENTGNNVVSCAACRAVDLLMESYKCDIKCNFVGTVNGEWLLILFVYGFKEIFSRSLELNINKFSQTTIVKLFTDQSEVNAFPAGCSTQDVGSG